MKKFCLLILAFVCLAGIVSGQSRNFRHAEPRVEKFQGTLQLKNGIIALQSEGNVYYVPILNRYMGFIEGLKDGAAVSIDGYKIRNAIRPVNVIINDKTYDFANSRNRFGSGQSGGMYFNDRFGPNNRNRNFSHGNGNNNQGRQDNNNNLNNKPNLQNRSRQSGPGTRR
jgi:hypothetical protein